MQNGVHFEPGCSVNSPLSPSGIIVLLQLYISIRAAAITGCCRSWELSDDSLNPEPILEQKKGREHIQRSINNIGKEAFEAVFKLAE